VFLAFNRITHEIRIAPHDNKLSNYPKRLIWKKEGKSCQVLIGRRQVDFRLTAVINGPCNCVLILFLPLLNDQIQNLGAKHGEEAALVSVHSHAENQFLLGK
jgi:hypothetical protein